MKFIIAVCFLSSAFAAPQYYGVGGGPGGPGGAGAVGTGGFPGAGAGGLPGAGPSGPCPPGQASNAFGVCVEAVFSQNTFIFQGPPTSPVVGPPPDIPAPKVDYDVVFVRTPEQQEGGDPIVIPPPEKRTIVYVLTKNGSGQQQIIEVPAAPGQAPEVFYINYNDGDNPDLAGGLTLQDVLEQGAVEGQVIEGDVGAGVAGAGTYTPPPYSS